jgi:putative addiction module killer protein
MARQARDQQAKAVIIRRVLRLKDDAGDIKSVGEGMSEMRIHCGRGYRVYFIRHGVMIVVLLCGGDKDSQAKISAGLNSLPDNGGSIMTEEFFPFDPVKALDSREAIEYFLADAFETGDAEFIAVARAEGLEKLSAQTG